MPRILDHPYSTINDCFWLRGNLHTHPRPKEKPDSVVHEYARLGYGFLGITEHDKFYSLDQINEWDHRGLVLVPGNEVSGNGPHILHVGADRWIEPDEDRQQVIDQINATAGFAIINHPNKGPQFDECPLELMERWTGYKAIEIFNAGGLRGTGSPYATDKWDILLSQGRRLWGIASDDYHAPIHAGAGWVMAAVANRTVKSVVDALHQGRFYASTGVTINRIIVNGLYIRIETADAHRIIALGDHGCGLATVDTHTLEFSVPENMSYVRFECWGLGQRTAWTQPFWIVEQ